MRVNVAAVSALVVLVLGAGLASGCGSTSDDALHDSLSALATPPPESEKSSPQQAHLCTASLRPTALLPAPGHMPAGTFMRRIQERGYLIAGVDQNTLFFSYLDPLTGRLQGFEIDLLRELAKAILGDPNAITFKLPTSSPDRIEYAKTGAVDIAAGAITMTCERWKDVAFSSVYYDAAQRVLVPANSSARGVHQLGRKRVCVRGGTTSLARIQRLRPKPIPYEVEQRTDCLVALQEGRVDAITADDSILRGFQAQDPYTKLLPGSLEPEPYGMAIAKSHPDFVRFVNGVLERMRADGTWSSMYHRWLGGKPPAPPQASYGD